MVSIVSLMENGRSIEVGVIGREGVACSALLLNVNSLPYRYFIQVEGHGLRFAADRFRSTASASKELRDLVLTYEASFRLQTMQGLACNGLHSLEQRCCRWLLMTSDRSGADEIKMTHEFLALMLGVRRASVTEVLAPLQAAGLIRSSRGTLTVLERSGLDQRACECYRIMSRHERESLEAAR